MDAGFPFDESCATMNKLSTANDLNIDFCEPKGLQRDKGKLAIVHRLISFGSVYMPIYLHYFQ